jgi:hypothetical protein
MKKSTRIAVSGGQEEGWQPVLLQGIRAGVVSFAWPVASPGKIATYLPKGEVYWS